MAAMTQVDKHCGAPQALVGLLELYTVFGERKTVFPGKSSSFLCVLLPADKPNETDSISEDIHVRLQLVRSECRTIHRSKPDVQLDPK